MTSQPIYFVKYDVGPGYGGIVLEPRECSFLSVVLLLQVLLSSPSTASKTLVELVLACFVIRAWSQLKTWKAATNALNGHLSCVR